MSMRSFIRRLGRLVTVAALVAGSVAGVAAATGGPALAANACKTKYPNPLGSGPYPYSFGPYTFAGRGASTQAGHEMRLDIDGPSTDNGQIVHLWHQYNTSSQQWCMAAAGYQINGHNVYKLRNYYTGKCLDIAGPSNANNTPVHQWGCDQYDDYHSQQWIQTAVSGGYTFENVYARRCLDVLDYRSDDGAPLQIWDCTGATNQIFF